MDNQSNETNNISNEPRTIDDLYKIAQEQLSAIKSIKTWVTFWSVLSLVGMAFLLLNYCSA